MCANAIPLRRSSLRYRPSAPPDARAYGLTLRYGAAQMNRCGCSAPRPSLHEACQQKLSHLLLPPARQMFGSHCSASGNNWGGFALAALSWASSLPLAPAHSAPGLEGGGKGVRSCHKTLRGANNSGTRIARSRNRVRGTDLRYLFGGPTAQVKFLDLLKKQYIFFNMKTSMTPSPQISRVLHRIAAKGESWAFTPGDFADIGDSRSIGMTLTRLVRDGRVRRIGRGLYDIPHGHPILGKVGAGTDAIVAAVTRKKKIRLLPSSAVAANQLGLTTQVPAKMIYHTDGAPSDLALGKAHVIFRRNTGRMLSLAGRPSGLVAQALKNFGKNGVTADHIRILQSHLPDAQKKNLLKDIGSVPAWMRAHFRAIAQQAQ